MPKTQDQIKTKDENERQLTAYKLIVKDDKRKLKDLKKKKTDQRKRYMTLR